MKEKEVSNKNKEKSQKEQEQLEVEMMDLLIHANSCNLSTASSWIADSFNWDDVELN